MRLKLYLLVLLSMFLSMGLHAQQNRFSASSWRVLDEEKCDGSVDIEIDISRDNHATWSLLKTLHLQFRNKSGNWENIASLINFSVQGKNFSNNSPKKIGEYNIITELRSPINGYEYYAYKLTIQKAPNPNERVAYRLIQKEDNNFLSDTKYITAYKPYAVNLRAANSEECDQVTLSWDKPSNTGDDIRYKIFERYNGRERWLLYRIVNEQTLTIKDIGTSVREYKVHAYNSCHNTGFPSETVEAHGILPIEAPVDFTAEALCNNEIKLTWRKPQRTPRSYHIQVQASNNSDSYPQTINIENGQITETVIRVDQAYQNYRFMIRTRDECSSYGPWSESVSSEAHNLPDTPTNFSSKILADENAFLFTWDDVSNERGYIIRRLNKEDASDVVDFAIEQDVTSYKDETVNFCTTYKYTLLSQTECGETEAKSLDLTMSPDLSGFLANFDVSKGYYSDRIELSWEVRSNRKVSEIRIYRSRKGEDNKELVASLESRQRGWTDDKSEANVLYDYEIVGIQFCGESDVETNILTETGFRMPFGTVYGNVAFEGGNPVAKTEIVAEPIDDSGLLGYSCQLNGNGRIEIAHRDAFSNLTTFTTQFLLKPEAGTSSDFKTLVSKIDEAQKTGFSLEYNAVSNQFRTRLGNGSTIKNYECAANLAYDAFSFVALSVSANEMKLFVNKEQVGSLALGSQTVSSATSLSIGGTNETNGFTGLMDEFAFFTIAKSLETIQIDYNRKLSAEEKNILVYLQMDEGLGNYAYDSSKSGRDYNKNHGQFTQIEWSNIIPSMSQLAYKALTDENGNYTLSFIKFTGRGQVFNITPIKDIHRFMPAQKRQFLGEGTEYVSIDFKDVSSFRVTGNIVYTLDDSNYPAKGIRLMIDGQILTNKGRVVETDANGEFDIQVPIGEHIIGVQKEGHYFESSTFPASGELYDFRENITGIEFMDTTSVLVAGRVVGGRIEGEKLIGFGLSQNNIGQATISFQSEQDDRYQKQVTTDANTGEYEIKLLPINTLVTNLTVENAAVNFKPESYSDILELEKELILKEEQKKEYEDRAQTIVTSVDTYKYNFKKNFIYRATPSISLVDTENNVFTGEESIEVTINQQTSQTASLDVSNKALGFPVLLSDKLYQLKIRAFESYTNPNLDPVVNSIVPVSDGTINIVNNLGDSEQIENNGDTETIVLNSNNGEVVYNFKANKPNLLLNPAQPELSFTENLKITLEAADNTTEWKPEGKYFRAYLLGSKTKGKGYVSTGPETVKWILHDPPGSNSSTFIEEGTTLTSSKEVSFHQDLSNNLSTLVKVGPQIVFGGGLLGPQITTDTKAEASINFNVSQMAGRSDIDVTDVTFNQRIQTSSDPNMVGAQSDLFIGYASNVIYGEAETFNLLPLTEIEAGAYETSGNVVAINGEDYQLAKAPSFYVNTNGFSTMFIYSHNHIENVLIPELTDLRNSFFAKPDQAYVSKLPTNDPRYGTNNDDVIWQSAATSPTPLLTDVKDYDGESYTFKYKQRKLQIDSVRWYNQQIRLWGEAIGQSEKEKIEASKSYNDKSTNISFVGGGQAYESSKAVIKSVQVNEVWDFSVETGFSATFGALINEVGLLNTNVLALKLGGGESHIHTNTTSNTYGYALADNDVGDAFTVDILDPETGSSPVFRLRAGRSSCPFEGPEESKYYQAGTVFNQGTQQREIANLEVSSSSIVDEIPAHESAVFTLNMGNASETGDASWYGLRVVEGSNPNGAAIKLNGGILSTPIEILGGSTSQVQLSLHKNPKYDTYEDVKIMMYSTCEFEGYKNYGSALVADTVTLSAYFIPSCGDIAMTKPSNNWVINEDSNNEMEIVVEGLGTIDESFKSLYIQYRPEGSSSWINLQKYVTPEALVEEGDILIENGTRTIKYNWNTTEVNEGSYEIRLLSKCKSDIVNESLILLGTIDREQPEIFGSVSPEDGVLNAGEVIRFTFTEELRNELLSKQNIKVRGLLNGGEITHSVAAYFDGQDNNMLIRTNGQSSNKSFTIEFWAKRSGDGKQVIFAQSSQTEKVFEIAFNADNKLQLTAGDENLVVPQMVEADKWFHWAASFDSETKLMTIFKNDEDAARKIWSKNITRIGDIRLGMASEGETFAFTGSLHELRIWNKSLSRSQIASQMSARLSGNEIDLQGLWRIDEATGTICLDEVRGRNAAFKADWEIYPKGNSAAFTGSQSLQVKSDKFAFSAEDDFTLSFWFNTNNSTEQCLFSNGDGLDADDINEWNIALNAEGHLLATNSGIEYALSDKSYNDGNWHHFAMVVKNPGATNILIDGNIESSISSKEIGGLAGSYYWLGAQAGINELGEINKSDYFNGYIDEFRIWNHARKQKNVIRDMRFKLNTDEVGLVAYLPFEKYIISQNIANLEPSFDEQSVNQAQVQNEGIILDKNVPKVKLPRAVEDVNFNILKSEREIVVQLNEDLKRLERCQIDISVFDVLDLHNNIMRQPYTHSIVVDKNQLRWNRTSVKEEFHELDGGEFIVEIVNSGIKAQTFSINNVPSWLELIPQAGNIEGGQSQEIRMIVHPGLNVGYYQEQLYLRGNDDYNEALFLDLAIQANKPKWSEQLDNFKNNMNIIGRLIIDDIPSTDENDMIAVYVGSELRGFAKVSYQKEYDNYAVYLSIGSNQTVNEQLKFKIWDASTGLVYPVDDVEYTFEADAIKGSISDPIVFRSGDIIQRDIELHEGWNWVSINLRNTDDKVNTVFGNIGASNGDRLISQDAFYQYDNDAWTGSDNMINFVEMYKIYLSQPARLRISGIPVDPITTQIELSEGWNWISYTPQFNSEINEALSLYNAEDNDEIKTMDKFARYDEQTNKWYGSLTHLAPGVGYQLNTQSESNLYYPETSSFRSTKSTKDGKSGQNPELDLEEGTSRLFVDSKQNMSLIAVLHNEMGEEVYANNITAYIDSKALSLTQKTIGPDQASNLFFITIPNDTESSEVQFKYEDAKGENLDVITHIQFERDATVGTMRNPSILQVEGREEIKELKLYPNPVKDKLSIELSLNKRSNVRIEIFNMSGQLMHATEEANREQGVNLIQLNSAVSKLSAGTYLISVKTDEQSIQSKFIKL